MVERYYGEQVLCEDAINFACADAYDNAIDRMICILLTDQKCIVQLESGKNFFYSLVTVKPEVELGEYKGLSVEKDEVVVTDDDVENELRGSGKKFQTN